MEQPEDTRHITIHDAVLNSASLTNTTISVAGKVVLLDLETSRLDLAHEGAKLIVAVSTDGVIGDVKIGDDVVAFGKLKRKQRRLYFEADLVECLPR